MIALHLMILFASTSAWASQYEEVVQCWNKPAYAFVSVYKVTGPRGGISYEIHANEHFSGNDKPLVTKASREEIEFRSGYKDIFKSKFIDLIISTRRNGANYQASAFYGYDHDSLNLTCQYNKN